MPTESVSNCPVCRGDEFKDVISCKDYSYSQQYFFIQKCANCNLHLTNPRPDAESIQEYYQSPDYISHTGNPNSILNSIYLGVRRFTLRWKHGIISSRKEEGSLLDYGCGSGEFLDYMARNGWRVFGVEPSKAARERAARLAGMKNSVVLERMEDLQGPGFPKFDFITLWHVLEHVPDLNNLLSQLKLCLSDNGLILIAVPNYQSFDSRYYKEYWAGYDLPRHFWHFSHAALERLLFNHGLLIQDKIPMKLDSFYVSILSEKYRRRKFQMLAPMRAFAIGLISNYMARKNATYSSCIYVISTA